MSPNLRTAFFVLGSCIAATFAFPAQAAETVQSAVIGIDESYLFHPQPAAHQSSFSEDYLYDTQLSFGAFDASLGTLTGVTLTLSGPRKLRGGGSIVRADGQGNGIMFLGQEYFTNVQVGTHNYNFATDGSSSLLCSTSGGPLCLVQDEQGEDASFYRAFSDFAAFTGTSPIGVDLLTELYVSGVIIGDDPLPLYTLAGEFTWSGKATLTYDYEPTVTPPPSAVPEPGSWALMIGGFGAVCATVRRRRRGAKICVG
jgi:hypothetical protein